MSKIKVVYNSCYGGFGLSKAAVDWLSNHGVSSEMSYILPRHSTVLVKCVEELGELSNGICAALSIYEIDGFQYRIEEYDGLESVIEPNDINWVLVDQDSFKN